MHYFIIYKSERLTFMHHKFLLKIKYWCLVNHEVVYMISSGLAHSSTHRSAYRYAHRSSGMMMYRYGVQSNQQKYVKYKYFHFLFYIFYLFSYKMVFQIKIYLFPKNGFKFSKTLINEIKI